MRLASSPANGLADGARHRKAIKGRERFCQHRRIVHLESLQDRRHLVIVRPVPADRIRTVSLIPARLAADTRYDIAGERTGASDGKVLSDGKPPTCRSLGAVQILR
jgi:hypothetical protein